MAQEERCSIHEQELCSRKNGVDDSSVIDIEPSHFFRDDGTISKRFGLYGQLSVQKMTKQTNK